MRRWTGGSRRSTRPTATASLRRPGRPALIGGLVGSSVEPTNERRRTMIFGSGGFRGVPRCLWNPPLGSNNFKY